MKKIILTFILLLIIPINTKALEHITNTSNENHLIPYYTNTFTDYNTSIIYKGIDLINQIKSKTDSSNAKLNYAILKSNGGASYYMFRFYNQPYLEVSRLSSYNQYVMKSDNNFPYYSQIFETSTSSSIISADQYNQAFSLHYRGYDISGYTVTGFTNNYTVVYSTSDIKLKGNNIYNGNIMKKYTMYGSPYIYSNYTDKQALYSEINFLKYQKVEEKYLSSGDNFYTADLVGYPYMYTSTGHKNLKINILNTQISMGKTFKLQFMTDNYNKTPPALYGCNNSECKFITYLNYSSDQRTLRSSEIFEIGNMQICIKGICRTLGDYASYEIRYKYEDNTTQNNFLIFNGSQSVITSYDTDDFEYVAPDDEGNYPTQPDRNDNGWFDRTEDYFNKLGDMELLEKLNPIYWLKGLGFILVDLFVPTNEFFETWQQETMDKLKSNFDITSIVNIAKELKDLLDVSNNEVPQLEMDFSFMNIDGFGKFKFDFSWYTKYRPIVHNFIIAVLLVNTLFWLIRKVSGLLS